MEEEEEEENSSHSRKVVKLMLPQFLVIFERGLEVYVCVNGAGMAPFVIQLLDELVFSVESQETK